MARVRSPNYPALSLPDAITRIRDVYKAQQTTPEPRDVVIKHMGYTSANGRALKSLSALIKYGFLDASGVQGLKVSDRAIAILFPDPDSPATKADALLAAAREPKLFQEIFDRWEGRPSEDSLKAFLIRNGFNANSVDTVAQAFYATFDLVSGISDSYDSEDDEDDISEEEELVTPEQDSAVGQPKGKKTKIVTLHDNSTKPVFDFETVAISTKIDNQEDLQELIERLEQIKGMLPNKTQH